MKNKFKPEHIKEFHSYMRVQADEPKFCAGCGEECKDGQPLWNGWFCYEEQYHLQCVPEKLSQKIGLKINQGKE